MLQSEDGASSSGSVPLLNDKSLTPLNLRLRIIVREIRVGEFNIFLRCVDYVENMFANSFFLLYHAHQLHSNPF